MTAQNGNTKPGRESISFPLGQLLATPGALEVLEPHGVSAFVVLARHAAGDWGEIDLKDCGLNEQALHTGARIFSVYHVGVETVWVITNAAGDDGSRDATTVLLPSEY